MLSFTCSCHQTCGSCTRPLAAAYSATDCVLLILQVCRVAYEIMQTLHPDASRYFHSLDDIYYFGGQGGHEETALYRHSPANRGWYDQLSVGMTSYQLV